MPPPTRIVLTGFMGSGKTTVGRMLSQRAGWPFHDLDHEIERRTGLTVPQIFAEHGELRFRALELEALTSLLSEDHVVIALGGGAIETAAVRDLLANTAGLTTIYLEAPFDILYERCRIQSTNPAATARPNLADPEAARARHADRTPLYESVATHRIPVGKHKTPGETVAAILKEVA